MKDNIAKDEAEKAKVAEAEFTAKNKPQPTGTLKDLSNDADATLAELQEHLQKEEIDKQRVADAEADFMDSPYGKKLQALAKAAEARAAKAEALLAQKGLVLSDGTPQRRALKGKVDPERMKVEADKNGQLQFVNPYNNFPIKKIDGENVVLVASVPFYDKSCAWDDGHRHESEHFIQSEHPNYINAVYCRIRQFKSFDKTLRDAFVVRTDEEVQLFYVV